MRRVQRSLSGPANACWWLHLDNTSTGPFSCLAWFNSISSRRRMGEMGEKMGEKKSITFWFSQRMPLHTVKWLWAKSVPFCEWWVFCSSLLQSYLPEWDIKSGHWMQMCCAAKCEKRILGEERPPRKLLKICLHTHKHTYRHLISGDQVVILRTHIHTRIDVQMQTSTDFTHTCIFLPHWWRSVFTSVPYGCQSSCQASALPHPSGPPAPTGLLQSRRRLVNCLRGLKMLSSLADTVYLL